MIGCGGIISKELADFKVRRLLDCERAQIFRPAVRGENGDYYDRSTVYHVSGRYRGCRVAGYQWVSNHVIKYGMFDHDAVFRRRLLYWCRDNLKH